MKRAPEASGVPQLEPFITDAIASVSNDTQKADLSKAIKAHDRVVLASNSKMEAQQLAIEVV
jgi:hypothetical protein